MPFGAWGFKSPLRHVFCATRNRDCELRAASRRFVLGRDAERRVERRPVVLIGVPEEPGHSAEPVDDGERLGRGERCGSFGREVVQFGQCGAFLDRSIGDPRRDRARVSSAVERGPVLELAACIESGPAEHARRGFGGRGRAQLRRRLLEPLFETADDEAPNVNRPTLASFVSISDPAHAQHDGTDAAAVRLSARVLHQSAPPRGGSTLRGLRLFSTPREGAP